VTVRIVIDALRAGRVTESMPGPNEGPCAHRFELADATRLQAAIDACPARAISASAIDDGRCVMCGLCAEGDAAAFRRADAEPVVSLRRSDLRRAFAADGAARAPDHTDDDADRNRDEGERLDEAVKRRLGRSLHVRHLDAGGCNGCTWELAQVGAPAYDMQRYGVDIVASPRHADVLLVTGVVTANLQLALVRTLDAMPRPRLVAAVGACAISGGIFGTTDASRGGADKLVHVDVYAAGCPPRPWAIMRALRLLVT
jgi:Ni,Fe-hydrogenase III small subunit